MLRHQSRNVPPPARRTRRWRRPVSDRPVTRNVLRGRRTGADQRRCASPLWSLPRRPRVHFLRGSDPERCSCSRRGLARRARCPIAWGPLSGYSPCLGLTLPVAHEIRQLLQTRGVPVDLGERGEGPLCGSVSLSPCAFEAEDARERGLSLLGVGTGALAELLPRRRGVENVVDDLEAEAQLRGVLRDSGLFFSGCPCQYGPDT